MAKGREPVAATATDDQLCALLERYACPVPFHEVRTCAVDQFAKTSRRLIQSPHRHGRGALAGS